MMSTATPSEMSILRFRRVRSDGGIGQFLGGAVADDAASEMARQEVQAPGKIWRSMHRKTFLATTCAAQSKVRDGMDPCILPGAPKHRRCPTM